MSGSERRTGRIYGYDRPNARLVAFSKAKGGYLEQYRLADGSTAWDDARGWYVEPGIADAPDAIVWITATGLHRAVLESATSVLAPSASPGGSGSPIPASTASPAP
jgi:hypothetical protein